MTRESLALYLTCARDVSVQDYYTQLWNKYDFGCFLLRSYRNEYEDWKRNVIKSIENDPHCCSHLQLLQLCKVDEIIDTIERY
jgi:hypothetical protein